MAVVKISQLAAAGALGGSEPLPVVQGGVTKQSTAQGMLFQPTSFLDVALVLTQTVQASTAVQTKGVTVISQDDSLTNSGLSATGFGGNDQAAALLTGSLKVSKAFASNGVTPPARPTFNAACTDLPTAIALVNQLRAALIADGTGQ